MLRRVGPL